MRRTSVSINVLGAILSRGQESGGFHTDVYLVDVYLAIFGISFHAVSNNPTLSVSVAST